MPVAASCRARQLADFPSAGPWHAAGKGQLVPKVLPVILSEVKTAISLPDELFQAVEAKARALKMSRSGLLAQAAREFIERHGPPSDATDAWNEALAQAGQPADEAAAAAFQTRSKRVVRESWKKAR